MPKMLGEVGGGVDTLACVVMTFSWWGVNESTFRSGCGILDRLLTQQDPPAASISTFRVRPKP